MARTRWMAVAIGAAFCIGCNDDPLTPPASASPSIDRFLLYARNWPTEEVELFVFREGGRNTVVLFRPARDGQPRVLLDSIGPGEEPEQVRELLTTFDVWALNAPNAPGAACRTAYGQRSCNITWNDYSIVMLAESGDQVRVQRYTGLEMNSGNATARALGDFVLAWAREREGSTQDLINGAGR